MTTELVGLVAGDPPDAWERLGFTASGEGQVVLGGVRIALGGGGDGIREWVLAGAARGDVDGLVTRWEAGPAAPAGTAHPNGALGIDHLVVFTDDRERTASALGAIGGEVRRRAGPPQVRAPMAFVRIGSTIVEVAEVPGPGGSARFWGLVAVVPDVDVLAASLGGMLGEPRDAVQPGRRIATVAREARLSVPLAFMTPR